STVATSAASKRHASCPNNRDRHRSASIRSKESATGQGACPPSGQPRIAERALPRADRGVCRQRGPGRLLQPFRLRGRRGQAAHLRPRQQIEPPLGQGEVLEWQARKRQRLAGVRDGGRLTSARNEIAQGQWPYQLWQVRANDGYANGDDDG